jgi:hypothetical protein
VFLLGSDAKYKSKHKPEDIKRPNNDTRNAKKYLLICILKWIILIVPFSNTIIDVRTMMIKDTNTIVTISNE